MRTTSLIASCSPSAPHRPLSSGALPEGVKPLDSSYTPARERQSCPTNLTSPWGAKGLGFARAPAVEEAAGRPRDLCTLVHAQPGYLAIGGRSARRPDPQPHWHRG